MSTVIVDVFDDFLLILTDDVPTHSTSQIEEGDEVHHNRQGPVEMMPVTAQKYDEAQNSRYDY